jgi:predicted nucleotidyltransferase
MIEQKDRIITIISMFFPKAKIYLFGSYARGNYTRSSDIDIAIDAGAPIPLVEKAQIKHMIEVLNLIQNVDIVDFQMLPEQLQQKITKEGVIWKNN